MEDTTEALSHLTSQRVVEHWWSLLRGGEVFRSGLGALTKPLPTETAAGFLSMYDPARKKTKRSTAPVLERTPLEGESTVRRHFDPNGFNFGKARSAEHIARLWGPSAEDANTEEWHAVLVNVSPLAEGHLLTVPSMHRGLPQVLTRGSVALAYTLAAASTAQDWKVLYNSTGAGASVNHLHLHALHTGGLFTQGLFPIELAPTAPPQIVSMQGRAGEGLGVLVSEVLYPVRAWLVEPRNQHGRAEFDPPLEGLSQADVMAQAEVVIQAVWAVVEVLLLQDVPHHMLIADQGRRTFIIPRQPQQISRLPGLSARGDQGEDTGMILAVSEVCGMAICRDEGTWETLDGDAYAAMLARDISLCHERADELLGMAVAAIIISR